MARDGLRTRDLKARATAPVRVSKHVKHVNMLNNNHARKNLINLSLVSKIARKFLKMKFFDLKGKNPSGAIVNDDEVLKFSGPRQVAW